MDKSELSSEIFPGVYKFVLPLFGEKPGPVNSYLFPGKKMTLVDTETLQTVDLLESGFQKFGFSFSDLDRIIFTHGHIDHYGGALSILERAGKEIETISHEGDKKAIETGSHVTMETEMNFNRRMGIPEKYLEKFHTFRSFFRRMGKNCSVTSTVTDNRKIRLGDYKANIIFILPDIQEGPSVFF